MCDYCSRAHEFSESDKREKYLCPECGREMWHWTSSEVDDVTELVVENYTNQIREYNNPKVNTFSKLIVECPYCHSKDTKKISTTSKGINTAIFGIFGTKRLKYYHYNNCDSDF